jgi:hypothetical protein
MTHEADEYAAFVDQPRFGRQLNYTGLDPGPADEGVNLHLNTTTPNELAAQHEAAWSLPNVTSLCHTRAFWNLVDKVLPDFRERKE